MLTSQKTYRRRKAILIRLEDISYVRNSLQRRIEPGHSSAYEPGPADEADRTMRDPQGAREDRRAVDAEMLALAKEAVELGGQGEKWVKKINAAAGRELVWLEETAWADDGRGNYWASDWKVGFEV